jgi:formate C-acetyltransferase
MLESLSKLPHRDAAGGSAAIIDLHPDFFGNAEEAPRLLAAIVKTAFFSLGVGQLQWNVVSAERMLQAQKDPEHYGNLQVRVAGYSQKFMFIEKKLQDHLIARHKHTG